MHNQVWKSYGRSMQGHLGEDFNLCGFWHASLVSFSPFSVFDDVDRYQTSLNVFGFCRLWPDGRSCRCGTVMPSVTTWLWAARPRIRCTWQIRALHCRCVCEETDYPFVWCHLEVDHKLWLVEGAAWMLVQDYSLADKPHLESFVLSSWFDSLKFVDRLE